MSTVSLIQKLIISFIHDMFHFENHPGGNKQIIRCKLNPFMKNELILIRVWLHSRLYILSDDILWNLEKTKYMPSLVHQRKNMVINIIANIKKRQTTTEWFGYQCMRHVILQGNYDLCKVKILSNASCNCGAPCENSHHSFLIVINIQIRGTYYLLLYFV